MYDSLPGGTETPICRPVKSPREACCLAGARVQDVVERLTKLVQPSDFYHLLVLHVSANDTASIC